MSQKKSSGIDIDLGNYCSQIAYNWAKKTFKNRASKSGTPILNVGGAFSNIMDFNGLKLGISSDGIGTKIEIAERTGIYNTLGYDLVAMVADDLVSNGIEPVNISNILDVDYLDAEIVDQLMSGLHDAANFAGIVVTGGEIAELGNRIGGYGDKMHFNWCSTAIGIVPHDGQLIDGSNIEPNDLIISLRSRGFRSNGFSLIRKITEEKLGDDWHNKPFSNEETWGQVILRPSSIYTPIIVRLIKTGYKIKGIAHITGGGIPDNLSRILKKNKLGAILDNLFEPYGFIKKLQAMGEVGERIAYRIWNMGNGMLLVVDEDELEDILGLIEQNSYQAKVAGKVTGRAEIEIHSMGENPQILKLNR